MPSSFRGPWRPAPPSSDVVLSPPVDTQVPLCPYSAANSDRPAAGRATKDERDLRLQSSLALLERPPAPKVTPTMVSFQSPKWFRVRRVPRTEPVYKPPKRRNPLRNAAAVSEDAPEFVQEKHTDKGKEVMEGRVAGRESIYALVQSPGQTLRNTDDQQVEQREIGEPRRLPAALQEALDASSQPRGKALEELFEENNVNLIEAFKTFDEDGSGSISTEEFQRGLESLMENNLISALEPEEVKQLVEDVDGDGSGEIEYAEWHNKYSSNMAAGALVRRHLAGSSGSTESINIRGRNNKRIGPFSDSFDVAARTKPNFHPGHNDAVHEHQRLSRSSRAASPVDSPPGSPSSAQGVDDERSSPVFGKKQGYGAALMELSLAHKSLLPIQTNQERTTLRRTSVSLVSSTASLAPMLAEDSVYNITSKPSLVDAGMNPQRLSPQRSSPVLSSAPRPAMAGPGGPSYGAVCPGSRGTLARPGSASELRRARRPFRIAEYTSQARQRLVQMQPYSEVSQRIGAARARDARPRTAA